MMNPPSFIHFIIIIIIIIVVIITIIIIIIIIIMRYNQWGGTLHVTAGGQRVSEEPS